MTDRPRQAGSSRRSFLKQTLAAGALALGADAAPTRFTTDWAGGFMRSEAANERQDELDRLGKLDCAIIGSGVSGLYTGWRLLQDKRYRNIAVFEMSNRTGGRLLTWLPYGKGSGLRAELGGMRFYEDQQLVWNLIKYLGLHMTRFYPSASYLPCRAGRWSCLSHLKRSTRNRTRDSSSCSTPWSKCWRSSSSSCMRSVGGKRGRASSTGARSATCPSARPTTLGQMPVNVKPPVQDLRDGLSLPSVPLQQLAP
jgi:Flavin containing amine oxidoreductase